MGGSTDDEVVLKTETAGVDANAEDGEPALAMLRPPHLGQRN
jgi:hypothetical protein